MHEREPSGRPQRHQRRERGMQAERPVERQRATVGAGRRDRDLRALSRIVDIGMGHDTLSPSTAPAQHHHDDRPRPPRVGRIDVHRGRAVRRGARDSGGRERAAGDEHRRAPISDRRSR
jgi:hypothetical protein